MYYWLLVGGSRHIIAQFLLTYLPWLTYLDLLIRMVSPPRVVECLYYLGLCHKHERPTAVLWGPYELLSTTPLSPEPASVSVFIKPCVRSSSSSHELRQRNTWAGAPTTPPPAAANPPLRGGFTGEALSFGLREVAHGCPLSHAPHDPP